MIGRDEQMVLYVRRGSTVKAINLGYATLDGNEYDLLRVMAEKQGYDISIDTLDSEVYDFADVVRDVKKVIQ